MDSPSADSIAIGIVGTGNIGRHHASRLQEHEHVTVSAIADVDDETREAAGEELGIDPAQQYADHTGLFELEALDATVITTPHALHYQHIMDAFDHDLHALCEKPLTIDTGRALELADRATENNRILMIGYQRHLDPRYQHARERWEGADLTPQFITAETTQNWIESFRDTWRTDPALSGGGQLYDTGSHLLDIVLWTTGLTPTAVSAEMVFDDDTQRVDKHAVLSVSFAGGAVANIAVTGDTRQRQEHVHIYDEEGAVHVSRPDGYTVIDADGSELSPTFEPERRPDKTTEFVRSIRTGIEPPATAHDAAIVTALTEAAYQSARTGERVEIETP